MFSNKIKTSFIKLLLPFFYKFFSFLKANSRVINYLIEKRIKENKFYSFEKNIKEILKNKTIIAVDVGSQGGFNSDGYISNKYSNIIIISFSGHANIDNAIDSVKSVANDFIEKPFETKKLLHIIEKNLEILKNKLTLLSSLKRNLVGKRGFFSYNQRVHYRRYLLIA